MIDSLNVQISPCPTRPSPETTKPIEIRSARFHKTFEVSKTSNVRLVYTIQNNFAKISGSQPASSRAQSVPE
jgi:hypothetical protein